MEVLGQRVLIKADSVEKVSAGGIILGGDNYERTEKSETTTGRVIDIGQGAYLDPALGGKPWVKVGDHVVYAKYSGKFVIDPEDEEEYVVINDDAIQCILGD